MRARIVPLAAIGFLIGCGKGGPEVQVLGTFQGGFIPDAWVSRRPGALDLGRYRTRGFVKCYLEKHKFLMELNGEQQLITVKGKWRLEKNSLIVEPDDVEVETRGGQRNFDPNRAYLPEPDLIESYSKRIIFRFDPKTKRLTGVVTSIAGMQGVHTFKME